MRQRREMSFRKFNRYHPGFHIRVIDKGDNLYHLEAFKDESGEAVAQRDGRGLERVTYELSEACYRLAGLDAMEKQGWADANTGQVGVPLERHHKVHRAHGRDDSEANLAGVSRGTHNAQHGQVQPSPRRSAAGPLIEPGR